ncbi:SURF1 family protein [Serinicoccus chungangensis]|uniref:SURF1 family protein n=1 Tax=Serinicoccus chungangensis TaxID=767452 RepID=UPI001119F1E2|nr:SURF1 family protein [Serinicoccus chungangensis]
MIRTALRPAWLALLALLLVVVVVFYQLGMWQLGVSSSAASREFAAEQAARPTVPLSEAVRPQTTFPEDGAGRSVLVSGSYLPEEQFLVPRRLLEGEEGYWVVTPVQVADTGALLPVVRGFVTEPAQADRPEQTPVELTGTLAPGEAPGPGGLPEGQRGSIDTAELVNDWDAPIYDAFVFLVEERPDLTAAAVRRVPPPTFGESGVVWRNVGYGLQWFVFAGFAVYMYLRFLHDASRRRPSPPDASPAPSTPAPPVKELRP